MGLRSVLIANNHVLVCIESHFAAPTGLGKHKLELLPAYMHNFLPHLKKEFLGKGKKYDKSPYFLIVCSSALRAVEVLKYVISLCLR